MKNTIWRASKTFKGNNTIVELNAEIRTSDSYDWENPETKMALTELTISSTIWEGKTKSEKNAVSGGQCLGSINPNDFKEKAEIKVIKDIWEYWHLNCTLPGSKAQEKALHKFYKMNPGIRKDYDKAVQYLRTIDLLDDNGYTYGSKWLGKKLPELIVTKIKKLMPEKVY